MSPVQQQLQLFDELSYYEGADVEYKSAVGGLPGSLWETYSAFANTGGGSIWLGVSQRDGKLRVEGVEQAEKLKGQIWTESGSSVNALPAYQKASGLAPFSGLIRASYGRALLENNRMDEAIGQLQKSLDREPKSPETHRFLAVAYGKQGKEGLASLHLAEGAYMQNKNDFAKKEAALAKSKLPKGSPGWLRADDIQNAIKKKKKKDN